MKQPPSSGFSQWQLFRALPKQIAWRVALSLLALVALVACDQMLPQSAWWLFVSLSLTAGFLHGALDVVLLAHEFHPPMLRAFIATVYLGAVLLLGLLLSQSWTVALFFLIAMSAWHFGEPYGRWERSKLMLRVVVGGASVMMPILVSPDAMHSIIGHLAQDDRDLVWLTWRTVAMTWLALVIIGLAWGVLRKVKVSIALLTEVSAVLALNILLSPLMAFALYFGAYHSLSHIARVAKVQRSNLAGLLLQPVVVIVFAGTAALLALLWWHLEGSSIGKQLDFSSVLRWLVVALAAVTLPHLLLVTRCSHLLTPSEN